jgi:hypothetical protein
VAQGVSPEFKPQYCKNKKKERSLKPDVVAHTCNPSNKTLSKKKEEEGEGKKEEEEGGRRKKEEERRSRHLHFKASPGREFTNSQDPYLNQ